MTRHRAVILTDLDLQRFWAKVALPDENGCMLWLGALHSQGYGLFGKPHKLAHRVSLLQADGPPADDKQNEAAHSCRNRHCVAPAHLRWATHAENMDDKFRDGTQPLGERVGGAKLTVQAVRELRESISNGSASVAELTDRYGVSRNSIIRAANGETWRHVNEATS